jgi:hypothetical protein
MQFLARNRLQAEQGTAAVLVLRALIARAARADGVLQRESASKIFD